MQLLSICLFPFMLRHSKSKAATSLTPTRIALGDLFCFALNLKSKQFHNHSNRLDRFLTNGGYLQHNCTKIRSTHGIRGIRFSVVTTPTATAVSYIISNYCNSH